MTQPPKIISTFRFSLESQKKLQEASHAEVYCITDTDDLQVRLQDAEILCSYWIPENWRTLAHNLRWIQCAGAGVDGLRSAGILDKDSGIIVTTAAGTNATTIAEYVFGSILMFNRSWPEMVRLQDRRIWPRSASWYKLGGHELIDQTLGIIGLGNIGRRVAQLGRAFGMRVVATRRSVSPGQQDPDVDRLYPMAQLHDMLKCSDYVIVAVPLTAETEGLIGKNELRAMQTHTYLVNVARGRVIDETKLIQALQEGWIAGAGLDVTAEEPLPADSPLYAMPNVILTPHISGVSVHYEKRLTELFAENLRRYQAGETLLNYYDPTRGY